MKYAAGLTLLCLTFPLLGCLKNSSSVEEVYVEKVESIISEVVASDLNIANIPDPRADILEYLKYAIEMSPDILALRQAELGAESNVLLAISKTRPQLSANSQIGGYSADASLGGFQEGASINVTASQLLFDGGQVDGEISISRLQLEISRLATKGETNRISAEAAGAIIAISLAEQELEALSKFKKEIKPHAAQLERMAGSGLIDRSIIDEISSQLLEIDISEEEAKSNLRLAQVEYSKFFGDLQSPRKSPEFPLSISSKIEGDLVPNGTPAVRERALRALLAEKQVEVARSAFSPKVNAQLGSSSPMNADESISAQAGILISYQLSDGGAREAKLSAAKNNLEQSLSTLQSTVENTEGVLRQLQERAVSAMEIIELSEQKFPILLDQLRVAETQIQTGQADISKVFGIKLQTNQLESRIRRAKADLEQTKFDLAAALGLLSN